MISANGVEYKNLPEQVQYLTERAAEFAVELDRVSASVDSVAGDVAALQTSYTTLAEDVRVAQININSLFTNVGTAFSEIANIKNGTTPLFETITDNAGNKRFVEGSGTPASIEGLTITDNKWSLSGSHLMIVLAGSVASGTQITNGLVLATYYLSTYITNKIKTVYGTLINMGTLNFYTNDYSVSSTPIRLYKSNDVIRIGKIGNYTFNVDVSFRIQFDLLIDAS